MQKIHYSNKKIYSLTSKETGLQIIKWLSKSVLFSFILCVCLVEQGYLSSINLSLKTFGLMIK